jgi:hypothetical protein
MSRMNVHAVRCEALFASALRRSDTVTPAEVRLAITRTIRKLGSRGCAAWVAQEYGDYPETAVARMRWARDLVEHAFTVEPAEEALHPREAAEEPLHRRDVVEAA